MFIPELSALSGVEWAEFVILVAGTLLVLAGIVNLTVHARWSDALKLKLPERLGLPGTDVIFILLLFLLMPSFFHSLIGYFAPAESITTTAVATRPTTAASDENGFGNRDSDVDGGDSNESGQLSLNPKRSAVANFLAQLTAIVVIVAILRSRRRDGVSGLGLGVDRLPLRVGQAFVGYLAVWPICAGLLHVSLVVFVELGIEEEIRQHSAIVLLAESTDRLLKILTVLSAVLLAPILEELVFRGVLYRMLCDRLGSAWPAAVVSGCAFGLIHFPSPQTVPPLIVLGIALSWIYTRTGSLLVPILLHAIFNGKTVLWLFLGDAP